MEWFKSKIAILTALTTLFVLAPQQSLATVTNTTVQTKTANGDGTTTNFSIGFDFRDNSWLVVTEYDTSTSPVTVTVIPYGSGAGKYTLSGGNPATTVVMGTAPTTTQYLIISRSIPLTQPVAFSAAGVFPYQGLSSQIDQITLELQNLNAGSSGGSSGGGSSGTVIPSGSAYNLLGWDSLGSTLVNYGGGSLVSGDILQFNGSSWVPYLLNSSGLIGTINGGSTPMNPAVGGTGVSNNGLLTWGTHALTFSLTADTSVTLPTSGTLIAGTVDTANTANTIVKRDASGNIAANQVTANVVGNVTGNITGNVTGTVTGNSTNVTGTVAIGHGGTGQTTQQAAINALLNSGVGVSGQVARFDGTNVSLANLVPGDMPANIAWTKMAAQTSHSILITDGLGAENVLPTNVNSGYVLTSNGVSPTWAPQGSGIPGIYPYGADTGTANAYVVANPNPPVVGYAVGVGISFTAVNSNTGASTINVSSLGAKNIVRSDGSALVAGDILAGKVVLAEYDGTNFQIVNPILPAGGATLAATTSTTATANQSYIDVNCAANCTITLPQISTLKQTYPFWIKDLSADTVTVTIQGTLGDTIDGATTATLNFNGQAITALPRSTGWEIQ